MGLGHLSKSLGTPAALAPEPALQSYITEHYALWRCAQEQIGALEAPLTAQPPAIATVAARLQTVPGVGPIVALTTVAVFSARHPAAAREPEAGPRLPRGGAAELDDRGQGHLLALPHPAVEVVEYLAHGGASAPPPA